ncbi:tryptophan-rich sensory protein [Novosphingobium sp. SG751A]|uniref:TspO/MBR family protein n=1 Tax=Novosphingobium sp. SG751A TaxID=2587000 RepID=UPI001552E822|nr:TspO/MBR family protein [Novosphingobium sp. SG751A]NOW46755.1 tryptophan-rich sensory protein [Novosphingobium sp. SG751A]
MTEIASSGQLRAGLARWVLVLVPGINLLGFLSASVSLSGPNNPWFASLVKPGIYPPPLAFPLVWTALYVMMGVALAIVVSARSAPGRGAAIALFAAHLVLNLAWSPVFFGLHRIALALGIIIAMAVSLVAVIALFWRVRPVAAGLMVPYLAWVLFASVLNWQFLVLNPDADGQDAPAAVHIQL